MEIERSIEELNKIEEQLSYRPHKIIKEQFYYYTAWYFTNDENNLRLIEFLRDMFKRDYLSKEYTGYGIDIIDVSGTLYETFATTIEGWNWFKNEMKIGRAWNEDLRLSKELKQINEKEIENSQ